MSVPDQPPPTPSASHQDLVLLERQVSTALAASALEQIGQCLDNGVKAHQEPSSVGHIDSELDQLPFQSSTSTKADDQLSDRQTSLSSASPHSSLSHASLETEARDSAKELSSEHASEVPDVSYLETPIQSLPATAAPLMSGVTADGHREPGLSHTKVHDFQRYFVANRCHDIYRMTRIHVPDPQNAFRPSPPAAQQESFLNHCATNLVVDKQFHAPVAYTMLAGDDRPLLKMVMSSIADVWEVYNAMMFSDVETGIMIGRVHTFPSVVGNVMFAFVPSSRVLGGVPSMQMVPLKNGSSTSGAGGFGEYELKVAQVETAVGTVTLRRHYFDVTIRHCTREEAVIWLALLIAAELETKTALVRFVPSH